MIHFIFSRFASKFNIHLCPRFLRLFEGLEHCDGREHGTVGFVGFARAEHVAKVADAGEIGVVIVRDHAVDAALFHTAQKGGSPGGLRR